MASIEDMRALWALFVFNRSNSEALCAMVTNYETNNPNSISHSSRKQNRIDYVANKALASSFRVDYVTIRPKKIKINNMIVKNKQAAK